MSGKVQARADGLTWQQVDEEVVILDLASSKYLSLNGSAALLWPHLVRGSEIESLTAALVDEFDISPETARADVEDFLRQCSGLGLLG